MEKDKKMRIPVWITPKTLEQIDKIFLNENFKSRSEFIEKASEFYIGYISSKENLEYLSSVLVSTIDGRVSLTEDRLCKLIFKMSVEISMLMNLYAVELDVDDDMLNRLRGKCIKDIKKTNGNINLKSIIEYQNSN